MQASLNRKQYRNFPYITHSKLISLFQSFYPKYARLNFRHGNGRRCGTINIYRQTVTVFVSMPAITNNFRAIPGSLESYRTNKSPSRTRGSYRGWINWHFGFRSWFPPVSRHFETLNSQIKVPQIAAGELSEAGLRQKRLSTSFLIACHSLYSLFLRGSHTSPIFYSVWHSVYNPVKGKRGNVRMSRYLLSFLKKKKNNNNNGPVLFISMDSAAFCPLLLHSLLRGRAKIRLSLRFAFPARILCKKRNEK